MSTIMLGVLSMPDELFWSNEPMARMQHNSVRLEAAKEIQRLERENAELVELLADLHSAAKAMGPRYTEFSLCREVEAALKAAGAKTQDRSV